MTSGCNKTVTLPLVPAAAMTPVTAGGSTSILVAILKYLPNIKLCYFPAILQFSLLDKFCVRLVVSLPDLPKWSFYYNDTQISGKLKNKKRLTNFSKQIKQSKNPNKQTNGSNNSPDVVDIEGEWDTNSVGFWNQTHKANTPEGRLAVNKHFSKKHPQICGHKHVTKLDKKWWFLICLFACCLEIKLR